MHFNDPIFNTVADCSSNTRESLHDLGLKTLIMRCMFVLGCLLPMLTSAQTQTLPPGWSMVGNDTGADLNVPIVFGNATTPTAISSSVVSVWSWNNAQSSWNFHAPSMTADALANYAAVKGYSVLTSLSPGDGYWVNAKSAFTRMTGSGTNSTGIQINSGWNLVSTAVAIDGLKYLFGDADTPSSISSGVITVWSWDNANSRWNFFAPSMTAQQVSDYAQTKGYGVLTSIAKGQGFWINAKSAFVFENGITTSISNSTSSSTTTTTTTTSSTTTISTTTSTTVIGKPSYISISGPSISTSYSASYRLVDANTGKYISADAWQIISGNSNQFNEADAVNALGAYHLLTYIGNDKYSEFDLTVRATYRGFTWDSTTHFVPAFKYLEEPPALPLKHEHDVGFGTVGKKIDWYSGLETIYDDSTGLNSFLRPYGYNDKGFVDKKWRIELPDNLLGKFNFNAASYDSYSYWVDRNKENAYWIAQNNDKILFVALKISTGDVKYSTINVDQTQLLYGNWRFIPFGDYFVAQRALLKSGTNTAGSDNYRVDLQVLKIDFNGNVIKSILVNSKIPNYGYPTAKSNTTPLNIYNIHRNHGDIIFNIPSYNWIVDPANSTKNIYAYDTYYVLDTINMSMKEPFWIKADKFNMNYSYTPAYGVYISSNSSYFYFSSDYAPTAARFGNRFWLVNRNFNNWSSTTSIDDDYKSGGIDMDISQDYSQIIMTSWGSKLIDSNSDWMYTNIYSDFWRAMYSTNAKNRLLAPYKNNSMFILPELDQTKFSGGCAMDYFGGKLEWFSNDCSRFQSYYIPTTNQLQFGQWIEPESSPWSVDYASAGTAGYSEKSNLSMKDADNRNLYVDLDDSGQHPGCTEPISKNIPTIKISSLNEVASLNKLSIPVVADLDVVVSPGTGTSSYTAYQYRAPVLCSLYKVSLDQQLYIAHRTSDSASQTTYPMFSSVYDISVVDAPLHGTLTPSPNVPRITYKPDVGFIGSDTFNLLVDDKSGGTQIVKINVMVY